MLAEAIDDLKNAMDAAGGNIAGFLDDDLDLTDDEAGRVVEMAKRIGSDRGVDPATLLWVALKVDLTDYGLDSLL